MDTIEVKTYRFKFSDEFSQVLEDFTRIHKFDKSKDFKEAWTEWRENNSSSIDKELRFLKGKGYNGNIYDKIYKSVRYYRKNKNSGEEKKEKKRKQYVSLDKEMLQEMDTQILDYLKKKECKPSSGFEEFMKQLNENKLNEQVKTLKMYGYDDKVSILNKFKKTYKNRYFIKTKKLK